jgi:hypothetical protein
MPDRAYVRKILCDVSQSDYVSPIDVGARTREDGGCACHLELQDDSPRNAGWRCRPVRRASYFIRDPSRVPHA